MKFSEWEIIISVLWFYFSHDFRLEKYFFFIFIFGEAYRIDQEF